MRTCVPFIISYFIIKTSTVKFQNKVIMFEYTLLSHIIEHTLLSHIINPPFVSIFRSEGRFYYVGN